MYGASAALGFGGSMLLVTVLTMLAHLIGQNVVRKLSLRTRGGLLGGWGGGRCFAAKNIISKCYHCGIKVKELFG